MTKLASIIESILFVAGNEIEESEICDKLQITHDEISNAIQFLLEKYSGDCGIHLLYFNGKLQFSSNPKNVDEVSMVLNPIREKELTKAMLETLAIIAYKQPLTRLDVEDIRGKDCTYVLQNLSRLNLIQIVGRKEAIGRPLLFGTTDEFLKRFDLHSLEQLPNYDELLERIQAVANNNQPRVSTDFYNSNRDPNFGTDSNIPDFLKDEQVDIIT